MEFMEPNFRLEVVDRLSQFARLRITLLDEKMSGNAKAYYLEIDAPEGQLRECAAELREFRLQFPTRGNIGNSKDSLADSYL